MTREEKRQNLRDRLIAVTEARIDSGGVSSLRARDLAAEAGCSVGGIYTVFRDLDDLVLQVNARTFTEIGRQVGERIAELRDAPPVGRLIAMAETYYDFAAANTARWEAVFESDLSVKGDVPEWYTAEVARLFEVVAEPVRTLRPDLAGDKVDLLARGLFSSVHGIVLLSVQSRLSAVPRDQVNAVMAMMLRAATRVPDPN
ncbi:MAG: TetR/AcrR family transcriptional regulator [Pseudomonadota bacterium]